MKALICPLNWGLGHATRCIPIIRNLEKEGYDINLMADGHPLQLLRQEFPDAKIIDFPSYAVRYSSSKSQTGTIVRQIPRLLRAVIREHKYLKKLQQTEKFDLIISDNRFGLWHKKTKSVYITHQLMIKMPKALKFLETFAWRAHRFFINRYDECWIPDIDGEYNYSGDLSHYYPLPKHAKFIGILSRFEKAENYIANEEYDTAIVISGPEPQRSLFEHKMIEKYKKTLEKTIIVQGLPKNTVRKYELGNLLVLSHLESDDLAGVFLGAKKIICRSGYSTIMDLARLNCLDKAEFYPTPGQTEQEYLAEFHQNGKKIHKKIIL